MGLDYGLPHVQVGLDVVHQKLNLGESLRQLHIPAMVVSKPLQVMQNKLNVPGTNHERDKPDFALCQSQLATTFHEGQGRQSHLGLHLNLSSSVLATGRSAYWCFYLLIEFTLQAVGPLLGDVERLDGVVQVARVQQGHEDKGSLVIVIGQVVEAAKPIDFLLQHHG